MSYSIDLHKEYFKFSASHFTIFDEKKAERLHGHNYRVSCNIAFKKTDSKTGMAFDFNTVKPIIMEICDELDEYVLIPEQSPFLAVAKSGNQVEVKFGKKYYSFPKTDVRLLPLINATSEELAKYFCEQLQKRIPKLLHILALSVCIEESDGQSVTYTIEI